MNDPLQKNLPLFIWHFLKPYKWIALFFICLATLAGLWGPFNSILVKQLINTLPKVQNENIHLLARPAGLIVLNFIVFDNFTWRSINYINYKFQSVIKNHIISEMMQSVLHHSHQFFQNNLSGRLANQINILADNVEIIVHKLSADLIRMTSLLIAALIASYYANQIFFYILFTWFVLFFSFSVFMSKHLVTLADQHASSEATISGQLVDCITNNSNIRTFAKTSYEVSRMKYFLSIAIKAFQKKELFSLFLWSIQGLMIAIMIGCAVYFLSHLYGKNKITVGDFALILGLTMELGHMMWFTTSRIDDFNQAVGRCRQSLSSLMVESEINDTPNAKKLSVSKGKIVFDTVKFHYKGTEPLFQNKSVTIEAKQKIGLVGYSGSGKSTFVNLILRLYDVTDGRILIDEQDVRDVTQQSLRSNIAVIPQDPLLFHRTLMENIRYGKINATDKEVILAAQKAHIHESIIKLPEGYNSLVGERGVKLSGGQRQRISIARAILKNAPILILDEATSQLDSVTEKLIQDTLLKLMQRKTTIVIAHRLSTLLHMDRILVFDKGIIVEDGTHKQLINKKGLYKDLWSAQIGGFLPDHIDEEE